MSRRRFIAGAICPRCGEMDRLTVEGVGEEQQRLCVACGYRDSLAVSTSREPKNRLDGWKSDSSSETARPVRILDPGDSSAKT